MYATKSNSSGYHEAPPDPDDQESLVTVRPRLKRVNTGVSSRGNESDFFYVDPEDSVEGDR